MAISTLSGIDVILKVNAIAIGCSQKIDIDLKTATSSAACRASGGWEDTVAGRHSWTGGTDVLYRITTGTDVPLNMTATQLIALEIARTVVAIEFGSAIVGDTKYAGNAIITGVKISAGLDGAATASVSLQGTGPLVATVNA